MSRTVEWNEDGGGVIREDGRPLLYFAVPTVFTPEPKRDPRAVEFVESLVEREESRPPA